MDLSCLKEHLKLQLNQLNLPMEMLQLVLHTTDLVFDRLFQYQQQHNQLYAVPDPIPVTVRANSTYNFDGVHNNLYELLPMELREKVLNYVIDINVEYYNQSHIDMLFIKSRYNRMKALHEQFPRDELITQKLNSNIAIGFNDLVLEDIIPVDKIVLSDGEYFDTPIDSIQLFPLKNEDVDPIPILQQIVSKEPNLQNCKILDFTHYINLNKITFENCELSNLKIVQFNRTSIKVLENLENFPNLQIINCLSCSLNEVKDMSYLTKLTNLNLSGNLLNCIPTVINKLTSLKILRIDANEITRIENISNLVNLELLDLCDNKIQQIENLNNCVNLSQLILGRNHDIIQIKNLDNLKNLIKLSLDGTSILKIENLNKLKNLQYLNLSHTNVSKIENLDSLVNLRELSLMDCHNGSFKKIENLDNLINLRELRISPCQDISRLENLDTLINLNKISIVRHSITKIDHLDKLVNLQSIDLRFGLLEDITNLNQLPNLKSIDVNFNKILKVGYLDNLQRLKLFKINEKIYQLNEFSNITAFLKHLENLKNEELDEDMEYFNDIRRLVYSGETTLDLINELHV